MVSGALQVKNEQRSWNLNFCFILPPFEIIDFGSPSRGAHNISRILVLLKNNFLHKKRSKIAPFFKPFKMSFNTTYCNNLSASSVSKVPFKAFETFCNFCAISSILSDQIKLSLTYFSALLKSPSI